MASNFALTKQFHEKFDPANVGETYDSLLPRRLQYLLEELQESATAADALFSLTADSKIVATETPTPEIREAKKKLVHELVDVLHVTYGFLHLLNVDAEAAFAEIMRANLSKDANPGGKAIKGKNFKPADMEKFI